MDKEIKPIGSFHLGGNDNMKFWYDRWCRTSAIRGYATMADAKSSVCFGMRPKSKWHKAFESHVTILKRKIKVLVVRVDGGELVFPWLYRFTWRFRLDEKPTWRNWMSDSPFYYQWCESGIFSCERPSCSRMIDGFFDSSFKAGGSLTDSVVLMIDGLLALKVSKNLRNQIPGYCSDIVRVIYLGEGLFMTNHGVFASDEGTNAPVDLQRCGYGVKIVSATNEEALQSVPGDDSGSMTAWIREGVKQGVIEVAQFVLTSLPGVIYGTIDVVQSIDRLIVLRMIAGWYLAQRYGNVVAGILVVVLGFALAWFVEN